jgi:hypothetical protein
MSNRTASKAVNTLNDLRKPNLTRRIDADDQRQIEIKRAQQQIDLALKQALKENNKENKQ